MSEHDDDALLRLAQSVTDGRPVDWEAASLSDTTSETHLSRLRILASIASVCGMPPDLPSPAEDTLFRWGQLEIHEKLGEGAFGEVFRGWDATLEREVAVKFLRAGAADAGHVIQEGRHLARIRHPGVVTVHGAEEHDGRVGIWMEHVQGRTLEDLLQEGGPFAPAEAIRIGIDLCRALAAVHGAGLVHRDVKTRNVVREDTGRIVLMDFGAGFDARSLGGDAQGLSGTPIYLAPEVLSGEPASPRSDLYGLGVLLYRLVSGGYPTVGASLEALRQAHDRGEVQRLSQARADLPRPFVGVVERALASEPTRRWASAEQMEAALVAARDAPIRAARRRVRGAALAAVALLAVAVTLLAQRWQGAPSGPRPGRPLIAITDVVNHVADPELDAVSGLLATSLEQSQALSVLTRSRMMDVLARADRPIADRIDRDLGLEICRRVNAAVLLVPAVEGEGGVYRIRLEVLDPNGGRRRLTLAARAMGKEQVPPAIDTLSRRARAALERDPNAERANARPVAEITTASLSAFHHYDRAERLIDRLALPGARAELERAIALDSSFALAHSRLAYVCWWLNDQSCEREQLAKAFALIDRVPERERFHLRAQGAMANREGLEASRSILLEMERFYPDDKEMLFDIGDYSSHLNEFPTAIQYLEKVIAMDPGFARALQHLARVYRDMGRHDRFLEWARRYAAADSAGDSYDLLGNALVAAGDATAGIETLARGRRRFPQRAQEFTMFIANARFHQGRAAEGLREWNRQLETTSSPPLRSDILRDRSAGRIRQGAYREALADLERAAGIAAQIRDPHREAIARMNAATLHLVGRNDSLAAFAQIRRCVKLESAITYRDTYFEYWPYWGGVFKLRLLAGDRAAAAALAKQKFTADKWYGPYVAAYLHAASGECAQASAAASRVLEWGPAAENIPLLYFLGRCQLERGQPGEAVESLRRLVALHSHMTLGPYYAKGLLLLGEAHERHGDARLAAESYSRLVGLWQAGDADLPDHVEARRRLASLEPGPRTGAPHGSTSGAVLLPSNSP